MKAISSIYHLGKVLNKHTKKILKAKHMHVDHFKNSVMSILELCLKSIIMNKKENKMKALQLKKNLQLGYNK